MTMDDQIFTLTSDAYRRQTEDQKRIIKQQKEEIRRLRDVIEGLGNCSSRDNGAESYTSDYAETELESDSGKVQRMAKDALSTPPSPLITSITDTESSRSNTGLKLEPKIQAITLAQNDLNALMSQAPLSLRTSTTAAQMSQSAPSITDLVNGRPQKLLFVEIIQNARYIAFSPSDEGFMSSTWQTRCRVALIPINSGRPRVKAKSYWLFRAVYVILKDTSRVVGVRARWTEARRFLQARDLISARVKHGFFSVIWEIVQSQKGDQYFENEGPLNQSLGHARNFLMGPGRRVPLHHTAPS